MSSEMAAFLDVGGFFFPEKDRSAALYDSPIVEILQDIRRKNVAAAAASNVSYLNTMDDSGSDPWESLSSEPDRATSQHPQRSPWNVATATSWVCTCPKQSPRHMSVNNQQPPQQQQQQQEPASSLATDVCFVCGRKKRSMSLPWAARRGRSMSQLMEQQSLPQTSTVISYQRDTRDPQHAQAMLQATPQLRILTPASTDMNLLGRAADRNPLLQLFAADNKETNNTSSVNSSVEEYKRSLVRDRSNQQAASELAGLLWVLSHEMSLEDYGIVESQVFSSVFGLVHSMEKEKRMAGLACVDALLAVPSADEEKKAIKFANTLSTGLRAAHGDYEFLSAVSRALGHMARRTANVDFVESEVTRALEWLRTDRSERR